MAEKKNLIDNSDKIEIFETDLNNLDENLKIVHNFKNEISGIFGSQGYTGDGIKEYEEIHQAEKNIKINFLNPVIILSEISKKIIKNKNSFIATFTSVAGLRGRKKTIILFFFKIWTYYFFISSKAKLFNDNILVTTIIPGYMNTKPFRDLKLKISSLLVTNPKIVASICKRSIDGRKEIVYINNFWRIIMFVIKIIPEKKYLKDFHFRSLFSIIVKFQ